jgi:mannitol/fructose-specific phosphotransferase system IIA component (Ntr-type)
MDLSNILREECVRIGTDAGDKPSVLREIAKLAKEAPALAAVEEKDLLKALDEREELGSTGFGEGIAIPHCALDEVGEFVAGILTAPQGVDFDSLDGKKARLFVFIVGPSSERNDHIRVLATVSQVLRIPGAVKELLAEKNAVTVRESFLRYSRDEVDTRAHAESCLFHVFVQSESKFYDILQIFTAMETCSVSVVEGKDAVSVLNRYPLFSSFWAENGKGFNRVIMAVVRKPVANETIRQINDIAGGLGKEPGIMVSVQEIFFAGGALS